MLSLVLTFVLLIQAGSRVGAPAADATFAGGMRAGFAARASGDLEAALEHFKAANALDPASVRARYEVGVSYVVLVPPNGGSSTDDVNIPGALTALRSVPVGDPLQLPALKAIAQLLRGRKDFAAARQAELDVLALAPDDAEEHVKLASLESDHGFYDIESVLEQHHLVDDGKGNASLNISACGELRERDAPLLDEALVHATRARELARLSAHESPQQQGITFAALEVEGMVLRWQQSLACGDAALVAQKQKSLAGLMAEMERWAKEAQSTADAKTTASPRP